MADPREYLYFYLIGRRDDELPCKIDVRMLADRVLADEPMRKVTMDAAERAATAAELDGFKRDWIADNKAEIEEAGGDFERAYDLYRRGTVDELAASLEPEVLEQVQDTLDTTDFSERANDREETTFEDDDPDEPEGGES